MMENLYLRGDLAAAFVAGEKAISFNPFDATIAGLVGLRMLLGGETERGTALLRNATSRFGRNPSYVDFGLFCIAYLNGDRVAAAQHADFDANGTYPYGLVARALVAADAGDRERARQAVTRLTRLYPGWSHPRTMLERFIRKPEIVDRLAHDLAVIMQP